MHKHPNLAPPTRKILIGITAAAVLAGIAVLLATTIGRSAGEASGTLTRERLETVWPSLMQMPVRDRAVLVGLAMTCELHRREFDASDARGQVVGCLTEAAANPDADLPRGVDRADALDTYHRLLAEAP